MTLTSVPDHADISALADPGLIVLDPVEADETVSQMDVTVKTNEIFVGGDSSDIGNYNAGVYTVEVRAWTLSDEDTGYFATLTIEIHDPCIE